MQRFWSLWKVSLGPARPPEKQTVDMQPPLELMKLFHRRHPIFSGPRSLVLETRQSPMKWMKCRDLCPSVQQEAWGTVWKANPLAHCSQVTRKSNIAAAPPLPPTFSKIALSFTDHVPARKKPGKMSEVELGWDEGEESLAARMHVEVELLFSSWTSCQGVCKHFAEKMLPVTKKKSL